MYTIEVSVFAYEHPKYFVYQSKLFSFILAMGREIKIILEKKPVLLLLFLEFLFLEFLLSLTG